MICFMIANLTHNARSRDTRRSPGRISNFFEGCANSIVHKLKTFFLRTHREHVGHLAWQVEEPIAHTQQDLLEVAPDGLQLRNFSGLDSILALLAATFRSYEPGTLLGELVARRASPTGSNRAQVRENLAPHLIEIVLAGWLTRNHALGEILIEL